MEGAKKSIEGLLAFADQFVPAGRRSRTPVLLKATAGLRAVDADKAEKVLRAVREVLAGSAYFTRDDWVGIIPGKEEGGLAWVSANYLASTFDSEEEGSLGVVELGGGSAQVTFEVGDGFTPASSDSFAFKTSGGKEYRLYAHSYLGYGQDHAQQRLRGWLQTADAAAEDPCYPRWYSYKRPGEIKLVRGTGDAARCQELIRMFLLDGKGAQGVAPGRYDGEPALRGRFVATENFFWERARLNLSMHADIQSMVKAAEAACEQAPPPDAGKAQEKLQNGEPSAEEPRGCFGLSYQVELMKALRSKGQTEPETSIVHQIKGGDVDWALGAVVVHLLTNGEAKGFFNSISTTALRAVAYDHFSSPPVLAGMLLAALAVAAVLTRGHWLGVRVAAVKKTLK